MKLFSSNQFAKQSLATLFMLLALPGFAHAALPEIDDQVIVTFNTTAGREDTMEIYGFSHEITCPRDAASGLPTGKRQHKPLSVTKPVDKNTPQFTQMMITGEKLTNARIDLYRNFSSGKRLIQSVQLINPYVCGMGNTPPADNRTQLETVNFCYDKIIWSWVNGAVSVEDSWASTSD